MKKRLFSLALLFPLVASCSAKSFAELTSDEYIETINASNDDFNILQLTDIHWSYNTLYEPAKEYLEKVISEAVRLRGHIDLIELTGDQTLIANKNIASKLYDLIDGFGIPWAFNHGNHDLQGSWSADWLHKTIAKHDNNVNRFVYDDIEGYSNFIINVKWDNDFKWQVYHIDTKNLRNNNGGYIYDYITDDQVEWYKAQTDKDKGTNAKYTPSLMYCHIPPKEIVDMEDANALGGVKDEAYCPSKIDSAFMNEASQRNCKGVFFGHDHSNDIVWKYGDMAFGYGVKSNTELYYTTNDEGKTLTGGSIVSLHKDSSSYELLHYYIDYSNVSEGVFDQWEATIA